MKHTNSTSQSVREEWELKQDSSNKIEPVVTEISPTDPKCNNKDDNHDEHPPDGGIRAWLVVLGGFVTYFTTFGLLNSFGVFQVYFTEHILPDRSTSQISWIGSTQVFLLFVGGIVFGPVFDRKGTKVLFFPGTILFSTSLALTSVSKAYYQFVLTLGVLFGIGNAMLFYPTISVMPQWFRTKRGLAVGLVVAGSSLGGTVWPMIIERLLLNLTFAWTIRVVAMICLVSLLPCCVLVVGRSSSPLAKDEKPSANIDRFHKDFKYITLIIGYVLVTWGMFVPFYYIPNYAVSRSISMKMATYLISVLNTGSLIGRVASGICADKSGVYNTTFGCAVGSGILLLCMTQAISEIGLIILTLVYGVLAGGLISLQSACVVQITPGVQTIGLRIGILMSFCSIGALTGAPIGGALISDDGKDYRSISLFCGLTLLTGALLVAVSRLLQERKILRKI